MLTIDALREYGANVDEGLVRCMNNADFYIRLVKMSLGDAGFDNLKKAVEAGDLDAAFEAAHALKGVLGNLALTPMYEPVSRVTELLRRRTETDYTADVAEILAEFVEVDADRLRRGDVGSGTHIRVFQLFVQVFVGLHHKFAALIIAAHFFERFKDILCEVLVVIPLAVSHSDTSFNSSVCVLPQIPPRS